MQLLLVTLTMGFIASSGAAIGFDSAMSATPVVPSAVHHIQQQQSHLHATSASCHNASTLRILLEASTAGRSKQSVLHEIAEENTWKNDLVLPWVLPDSVRARLPRFCQAWLRNYLLSFLVYFGVAGLWAYYIYYSFGDQLFTKGTIPSRQAVLEQIKVSVKALPMYSALPAFNEMLAEQGWTRAYARLSDVGLGAYVGYMAVYMLLVEFGVYWMHRSLHELPWAYRHIHATHHKYNKENTLSPFAGLAFHPLDGVLQAIPYTIVMLFVPVHFLTHELLLFFTGVWTTNIHDCLHGNVPPIMGAGYHTIHHTTYKHNYGQFFTLMDALHGTLVRPEDFALLQTKGWTQ